MRFQDLCQSDVSYHAEVVKELAAGWREMSVDQKSWPLCRRSDSGEGELILQSIKWR